MTQREALPVPAHIAIFMDGNGRWAKTRGLARTEGHREGLKAAKRIVLAARNLGVKYLTLYTFSTENWKRAQDEVAFLMGLIKTHLTAELDFYRKNEIRVVHSGDPSGLPADVLEEIRSVVADTSGFTSMTVNLAINYGGRNEILRAMKKLSERGLPLDEKSLSLCLDHPEIPDPDLLIRTSGEMRLSNFLLWQSSYSELIFVSKLWPDFDEPDLAAAIAEYRRRDRRYGGSL
jgi:undecaprenyl diphosphate synthase